MNDYARLLPADAQQRLEARLAEREQATGAQMVVAIFPSLEGENDADFGIRLAEKWRIGQKGLDNGVILLVFVQDRKVRAEIGYGLEPVLTDAVAAQIIREAIAPRFREQRYAAGLEAAVDAVYARIETRGAARGVPPAPRHAFGVSPWTLGVLAIFGIIALILARDAMGGGRARRNGYTAGGRRGWSSPSVIVPPMWGGWGGGRGGGGGGGGFSAGGGSFGGGGASGDW
ncbi:MAG TPA: TPM domain-containing protein [Candidatus Acidoferrum sp.]|nr:TPM domain-containing protein [Candidatus Acidoferrum sp.]